MELESGRSILPWRDSDCRSVSCSLTSWDLARKLHPNDESGQNRWMMADQDLLDNCKIQKLVTSLRSIQTPSAELAEKLRTEAEYFRRNARRMAVSEIPRRA
jgi:hypothetical protein